MTKVITLFTNKEKFSLSGEDYTCQTWFGIDMNIPSDAHNAKDAQAMRFLTKKGLEEKLELTTLTVLAIEFINEAVKQLIGTQPDYKAGEKPTLIIATNEAELSERFKENTKNLLVKSSAETIEITREFSDGLLSENNADLCEDELHKNRLKFLCTLLSCFFEISIMDLTKQDNKKMFTALQKYSNDIFKESGLLDIASSSKSEEDFSNEMERIHKNAIEYIISLEYPAEHIQAIMKNPIVESSATTFMRDDVFCSGTVQ